MSASLRCLNCGRPIFVNEADGVAYHDSTGDRECHYYEGTPLARTPITPPAREQTQ